MREDGYQPTDVIAGKVAVVVGGAGGIGRAVAARLGEAGCRVVLIDKDGRAAEQAKDELGLQGAALAADIANRGEVEAVAAQVKERFGGVDILVNAAGINTKQRTLEDISPQQWERVIGVNLTGAFHCAQAFLDVMREQGAGTIVTIVSTSALMATAGAGVAYCAAKRALLSLMESVNAEQAKHGIRACAVSPGEVDTPLVDQRPQPPSTARRAAALRPGDVAEAVFFAVARPPRVTVSEIVMYPSAQLAGDYET